MRRKCLCSSLLHSLLAGNSLPTAHILLLSLYCLQDLLKRASSSSTKMLRSFFGSKTAGRPVGQLVFPKGTSFTDGCNEFRSGSDPARTKNPILPAPITMSLVKAPKCGILREALDWHLSNVVSVLSMNTTQPKGLNKRLARPRAKLAQNTKPLSLLCNKLKPPSRN